MRRFGFAFLSVLLISLVGAAPGPYGEQAGIAAGDRDTNEAPPVVRPAAQASATRSCTDTTQHNASGACVISVRPGVEVVLFGAGWSYYNNACTQNGAALYAFSTPSNGGKLVYRSVQDYFATACSRGQANFGYVAYTMPVGVSSETFTVTESSGLTGTQFYSYTVTASAISATEPIGYATDDTGAVVKGFRVSDGTVTQTFSVGANPSLPLFDSTNTKLFVPNAGSNTLSIIDLLGLTTSNLTVGSTPNRPGIITVNGVRSLYVASESANMVSVIDPAAATLSSQFTVGTGPRRFTTRSGVMWLAQAGSAAAASSLASVDLSAKSVTATVSIGSSAGTSNVFYDSNYDRLYARNRDSGTLSVIDPTSNSVAATVSIGSQFVSYGFASSAQTRDLIRALSAGTSGSPGSTMVLVDEATNSSVGTIQVGNGPSDWVKTSFDNKIYVANRYSGTVSAIDSWNNTVSKTITVGQQPVALAYVNRKVYVANYGSGTVSVIDIDRDEVIQTIQVGGNPSSITIGSSTSTSTAQIAPQDGWWWNPNESGRGYGFETRNNKIFMATYMYRTDGSAVWYVGTGTLSNGVLSVPLQEYTNGESLSGAYQGPSLVGTAATATITFTSGTSGTIVFSGGAFGSGTATTSIARFPFTGSTVVPPSTSTAPETGWYWQPTESGTGYFIEVQGNQFYVAYYAYDTTGPSRWYIVSGTAVSNAGVFGAGGLLTMSGTFSEYANGQALTGSYRTPSLLASRGTVTILFSTPTTAQVTLPSGRQLNIQRFYSY
ncbi:MAG: YncE family protein [Proteobacteria bacterium]|nr:YncE family protein [Pseudomonadota bacterium]